MSLAFGKFHSSTALIFLTLPHYNTGDIGSSAAEHQIVCKECSANCNWDIAQETCLSSWKELKEFVLQYFLQYNIQMYGNVIELI